MFRLYCISHSRRYVSLTSYYNSTGGQMKLTRSFLAIGLSFSLCFISFISLPLHQVSAQDTKIALQRGYRTGYSDGFMSGYRDSIDDQSKSYARHREYEDARRAYNKDYGSIEDYRDGYRQGFEIGYETGFEKKSFESTIPAGISRRGLNAIVSPPAMPETVSQNPISAQTEAERSDVSTSENAATVSSNTDTPIIQKISYRNDEDPVILIPRDTELIVELQDDLGTEQNRGGDKFTAKIVSPSEISGAIIEGRVERTKKPGRIKRRAEMELSFDRIVITESRWSNFAAILTEVLPVKGDNIKKVDSEGTAVGQRSYKEDGIKVGAATGAGAGIGAITAGPVGAAVGAGVGAAFGVGAVVIERGKHIRLNRNQQLRVRTSFEIKIR